MSSMLAGVARSKIKGVLKGGEERDDNAEEDLVSHADYIEEGQQVSPQKSDALVRLSASIVKDEGEGKRREASSATSPPAGGGGDGDREEGEKSVIAKQKRAAFYARERRVVALSQRLLRVFYLIGTIFAALIIWQLVDQRSQKHVIAWSVGAIFVGIAVPFSLHDIHMHTLHYVNSLQKYYIRILWMVPIYAIESWLALRFKRQKIFLETAREAYEAYVIYNFYMLFLNYLGGGQAVRDILKTKSDKGARWVHLFFPFCCLKWKRSGQFINRCTVGVFQYVIIRFFCAFITCLLEYLRDEEKGNQEAINQTITGVIVIINCAQIWAMYCLVMFYHEFHHELRAINPFWKFVVVKTVVFLSFWQGLFIEGLAQKGFITSYMDYTKDDVASGIQDFLICMEMAGISIAHKYVFSYKDMAKIMKPEDMDPRPVYVAWIDMLPWDTMSDFREQIFNGFGLVHKMQKAHDQKHGRATTPRHAGEGEGMGGGGGGGGMELEVVEHPEEAGV